VRINIIAFVLEVLALLTSELLFLEFEHFVGSAEFALVALLKFLFILYFSLFFLIKLHEAAS
jgi:hypothetical protein